MSQARNSPRCSLARALRPLNPLRMSLGSDLIPEAGQFKTEVLPGLCFGWVLSLMFDLFLRCEMERRP